MLLYDSLVSHDGGRGSCKKGKMMHIKMYKRGKIANYVIHFSFVCNDGRKLVRHSAIPYGD